MARDLQGELPGREINLPLIKIGLSRQTQRLFIAKITKQKKNPRAVVTALLRQNVQRTLIATVIPSMTLPRET